MATTLQSSQIMNDPFSNFATPAAPNPYGGHQQQPAQEQGSAASGMNNPNQNGYYQNNAPPQQAPAPSMQQQPVNDNPFAAYGYSNVQPPQPTQQQQQSMVPVNQQTNQWSMSMQQPLQQQQSTFANPNTQGSQPMGGYFQQPQMQTMQQQQGLVTPNHQKHQPNQLVPSSAQSIASSNYMTPGMVSNEQMNPAPMMNNPSGDQFFSPQQHQQPQQNNGYMQQTPQEPPPAQPAPAPVHAPPPAPVVTTVDEEEDDFFGAFSTKSAVPPPPTYSPRPPAEVGSNFIHDSISVLSKSTNGTERVPSFQSRSPPSPLDDPRFAPKPSKPHGLDNAAALAQKAPAGSSRLPNFDSVTHSGYALARISFRTILIKKWKQVFWVTYGENRLLVFRSSADFEDWVSNPYLTAAQRSFLVKLEIDLVGDTLDRSVRGYQVTNQRLKNYNGKGLYQFKIERWMEYGPTIAAAFGSPNEREIFQLRTVFSEMLKRVPKDRISHPRLGNSRGFGGGSSVTSTGENHHNPRSYPAHSYGGEGHNNQQQRFNYSDAASTGMMRDQASMDSRSLKSQGMFSTGPIERRSDPMQEGIAGYYPTSRNGFQY